MNKTRLMTSRILILIGISFAAIPMSWGQSPGGSRTIGDILNNIENKSENVSLKKERTALPTIQREHRQKAVVNLNHVQPPSSTKLYYPEGTDEADLEQTTDQSINQLYKLAREFRNSPGRGEIWLRLAEQYVDKARLIEYRVMSEHDQAMAAYEAGKGPKPAMTDLSVPRKYNKKAIELYQWFVNDFQNDSKIPQALFFLGYNYFQLGQPQKGEQYYLRLTTNYPNSEYVTESNFALGEYYFGNGEYPKAIKYYGRVASDRSHHLYSFGMYKLAWCYYKLNKAQVGLKYLEQVILEGRRAVGRNDQSFNGVSHIRLAKQAIQDLIVFFAESGDVKMARPYFTRVIGSRSADADLAKLAYFYLDIGNRASARYVFKDLIAHNPNSIQAYDYEYAIVKAYDGAGEPKIFNQELQIWLHDYGPGSLWQQYNSSNRTIIAKADQIMESLVRNHVLLEHEVAQKSRTHSSYVQAQAGYDLYFRTFHQGDKMDEMHFFYGELLFDLGDYKLAAQHYSWVVNNAPKSQYYRKALLDSLLAYEKLLPSDRQIRQMVGSTTKRIPFTPAIQAFEGAALQYLAQVHSGQDVVAVKYRLGSLYYAFNHFNHAISYLTDVVQHYPKTRYAQYSADHLLDIYNIKHDYAGLKKEADQILAIPALANSPTGAEVREIKVKTEFKLASNYQNQKNFGGAAQAYESFAQQNSGNALAAPAMFNAAVNFERSNQVLPAIKIYSGLAYDRHAPVAIRKKASTFLPVLYEKTGQYPEAARAYEAYAAANPGNHVAIEYRYNAAVIYDGLNSYGPALRNYNIYFSKSHSRDRVEVLFLIAKLYQRMGESSRAIGTYEKYLRMGPSNASNIVEATYTVAKLEGKMGHQSLRDKWFRKTIAVQRRLSRGHGPVGVSSAAQAKYKLVYPAFQRLIAIRIPKSPRLQKRAITEKLAVLAALRQQLKAVINYNDGPEIVDSLTLLGQALQNMYDSIVTAPVPAGLNAAETKQYQTLLQQKAEPFKDEAMTTYQTAIKKGSELEAYAPSITVAFQNLGKLKNQPNQDHGTSVLFAQLPDTMGL